MDASVGATRAIQSLLDAPMMVLPVLKKAKDSAVATSVDLALRTAVPVYVSHYVCNAMIASAGSFPDVPLQAELLPANSGWITFETPLYLGQWPDTEMFVSLSRLLWYRTMWKSEGTLQFGVGLIEIHTDQNGNDLASWSYGLWPYEDGWDHWGSVSEYDDAKHGIARNSRRFIMMLLTFMQQEIVESRKARPHKRAKGKRGKAMEHIPFAQIVEFRRRRVITDTTGDEQHATGREYDYQWMVRGHWRNQWYPSTGRHKPRWINPYIKGPEDKPLKEPRSHVFAVVR